MIFSPSPGDQPETFVFITILTVGRGRERAAPRSPGAVDAIREVTIRSDFSRWWRCDARGKRYLDSCGSAGSRSAPCSRPSPPARMARTSVSEHASIAPSAAVRSRWEAAARIVGSRSRVVSYFLIELPSFGWCAVTTPRAREPDWPGSAARITAPPNAPELT